MLGTIVNTATIITGSIIGSTFKKGIKEKHQAALYVMFTCNEFIIIVLK